MRTNIIIDNDLMERALVVSGFSTKRATVEAGLRLLIEVYGQIDARKLRGKIAWEGDLKQLRAGRIAEAPASYKVSKK
jgi:Arc/MetJ family transcription regulator